MDGFHSVGVAPAYFRLTASPEFPVILERFDGNEYQEVRRFEVTGKADIVPDRPYLLDGRRTIIQIGDNLVAPIEISMRGMRAIH